MLQFYLLKTFFFFFACILEENKPSLEIFLKQCYFHMYEAWEEEIVPEEEEEKPKNGEFFKKLLSFTFDYM